jgi:DNA repair protein RadA/Sms
VFGELSLSGAIRPVAQAGARLREAGRLGFRRALVPASATAADCDGMVQRPLSELSGLLALFPAAPPTD